MGGSFSAIGRGVSPIKKDASMKKNPIKLSKRLQAAAGFAREGGFVADVGTDHAYLPLWLLLEGRIRGGVVSDIHQGPIDRAAAHIRQYGAEGRLTPILCDGLTALEGYRPEDIFILGMGGELIARIIDDAPMTKRTGVRMILQPMTHPERVRAFLSENGYTIADETLVKEDKIYQILVAEYTGVSEPLDELSLHFGKKNLLRRDPLLLELLCRWEGILTRRKEGKRTAGEPADEEERLLGAIEAYQKGETP